MCFENLKRLPTLQIDIAAYRECPIVCRLMAGSRLSDQRAHACKVAHEPITARAVNYICMDMHACMVENHTICMCELTGTCSWLAGFSLGHMHGFRLDAKQHAYAMAAMLGFIGLVACCRVPANLHSVPQQLLLAEFAPAAAASICSIIATM